jgi:hypothetical protein
MSPKITAQDEFMPAPSPMPDLVRDDRKIAFGRVVMPYFLGLKKVDYVGIDDTAVEAAASEKFRPYLFPGNNGEYAVNGIALSSAEYGYMVRFPRAYARAVNNSEYDHQRLDKNIERRQTKADTQEAETLENRQKRMNGMIRGVQIEKKQLAVLRHEARSPGYAHITTTEMREAVFSVYDISFKRILEVVGREKGWSREKAELAAKALDVRLFFRGAQKVANWRAMMTLADEYGSARENLFQNRLRQIKRLLGTTSVQNAS